jgi:glycosyltransferase involved in cell wall biosynthesis
MRVLYVNQTADVSGAERSLLTLLGSLRDSVEEIVACPDGELASMLAQESVSREPIVGTQVSFRLHPVHTSRGLSEMGRSAIQIRGLTGRLRPDVVHANTTRASLLALLARRRRPPVLAHIRDWAPSGAFARLVLGFVARRADMVVANSAYIAAQFDGLPCRGPVRVIHNPVDLGKFDPARADRAAERGRLGLGEDTVALAVVAQITPWKGQEDAIRILGTLRESGHDAVLLIAGSAKFAAAGTQFDNPAYERKLRALVGELGIGDRVRFLGERADVPDVLAATDVLLVPSWREAFGRIAVEGMAMGVPVVASQVGGPAEIVRPGVDGLLLPPRQPALWAERLGPLLDDAVARGRMGESGRARARDFSAPAHAERILDAYRELASAAGLGPRGAAGVGGA